MLTKRCLILQERQAGDAGRFLDILTKTEGVLEVFVRGSKKANSKHLAATQPFAYSKLCLAEKNGRYYVESAEPIHLFYGLREHLTQLALAAYFFDLIRYAVPTGQQQNFILRLTLNTLYYLTTGNRSEAFLKSVFELRFLSELGMMPDVLVCPVRNPCSIPPEQGIFIVRSVIPPKKKIMLFRCRWAAYRRFDILS